MNRPRRQLTHQRAIGILAVAVAALVLLAATVVAGTRYLRARHFDWSVRRGLALLADCRSPAEVDAALQRWERETASGWADRQHAFIHRALRSFDLDTPGVRRLLTYAGDVDFGPRAERWQEWLTEERDIARGRLTRRVRLRLMWQAPVGLTDWFSAMLAIDGRIYVPSLGRIFDDASDDADGVIVVDGVSGAAEYLYEPAGSGARDVMGIAAGDGVLFLVCRNGLVACIEPDGTPKWRAQTGERIASVPIVAPLGDSPPADVAVVTEANRLVALDGASGRVLWVSNVTAPALASLDRELRSEAPAGIAATVSAGPNLGNRRTLTVVNASGESRLLFANNGRAQSRLSHRSGGLAGLLVMPASTETGFVGLSADLAGRALALTRPDAQQWTELLRVTSRGYAGIVAPPRTLTSGGRTLSVFVTAGAPPAAPASVLVLDGVELLWRRPIPGQVWSPPAIADLNGDGTPEIIVISSRGGATPQRGGEPAGWLTVLSGDGRCLAQRSFEAELRAAPLVADVTGDGKLNVLVADRRGVLHCFDTGASGAIEWGSAAGDVRNTRDAANAYSYGQTPHGFQWRWRPR